MLWHEAVYVLGLELHDNSGWNVLKAKCCLSPCFSSHSPNYNKMPCFSCNWVTECAPNVVSCLIPSLSCVFQPHRAVEAVHRTRDEINTLTGFETHTGTAHLFGRSDTTHLHVKWKLYSSASTEHSGLSLSHCLCQPSLCLHIHAEANFHASHIRLPQIHTHWKHRLYLLGDGREAAVGSGRAWQGQRGSTQEVH